METGIAVSQYWPVWQGDVEKTRRTSSHRTFLVWKKIILLSWILVLSHLLCFDLMGQATLFILQNYHSPWFHQTFTISSKSFTSIGAMFSTLSRNNWRIELRDSSPHQTSHIQTILAIRLHIIFFQIDLILKFIRIIYPSPWFI